MTIAPNTVRDHGGRNGDGTHAAITVGLAPRPSEAPIPQTAALRQNRPAENDAAYSGVRLSVIF
ncbi:hypothetical protein ABIB66_007234 [Bradyrhizobium sp. F1.13.3]